jgi:hypothetical protein
MKFLKDQITSLADVKLFIDNLVINDKLFHFEDDPADVTDINEEPIFTSYECHLVDLRIDEICELNLLEQAFDYALTQYLND